jgi:hypothetical protein
MSFMSLEVIQNSLHLNFLQSIVIWRAHELVTCEQHHEHLMQAPEIMYDNRSYERYTVFF